MFVKLIYNIFPKSIIFYLHILNFMPNAFANYLLFEQIEIVEIFIY